MFGQITDGSYADKLTMQKYSKEPYKYQPHLDEKMNGNGNTFSHQGCKMTAAAKIASEVTGKDVDIFLDINQKWDSGKDGYLTKEEIAPVSESNWSINGTAVEHSVYVPLN